MSPPNSSSRPACAFLHRVRMDSVPLLHRYYRKLRLPAILPLASLRLGCAYHLRVCSFAPAGGQTQPPRAGNLGCGVPLSACQVSVEMAGPPRFLGSPSAYMPCSSTPAGPRHQASSVLRCCLPSSRRRRLPQCGHFGAQSHGLHARCLRFAAAVTRRHARLASGWWLVPLPGGIARRVRSGRFRPLDHVISWRPPSQAFPWRSKI